MRSEVRALSHLQAALVGLLRDHERLFVREIDYGRIVQLRLDVGGSLSRRSCFLNLSLEEAADLPRAMMCAIERLRAALDSRPHDSQVYAPYYWVRPDAWAGQRLEPTVPPDTVPILIEFAKAGRREDFEWLAKSAGVQPGQLEELWRGTLARLGPQ